MRVAVPMVGSGFVGDPQRPMHLLHGQMHYDLPNRTVVFTDMSFEERELALPGVVVLDGTMEPMQSLSPEETSKVKAVVRVLEPGPSKAATRGEPRATPRKP